PEARHEVMRRGDRLKGFQGAVAIDKGKMLDRAVRPLDRHGNIRRRPAMAAERRDSPAGGVGTTSGDLDSQNSMPRIYPAQIGAMSVMLRMIMIMIMIIVMVMVMVMV